MAMPVLGETELNSRMREQREAAAAEGSGVAETTEDPLAASMREQAEFLRRQSQVTRLRTMNAEAATDATKVEAAHAGAEASLMQAEASKVGAEVTLRRGEMELRQLENERKVAAMVDLGIPETVARRALGLAAQGQVVAAVNGDGSPTSVFTQFTEGMAALISLNKQIATMGREAQPVQPGVVSPVAPPSLADEFRKMRETRMEVAALASEMGFISRDEMAHLAPPPAKTGLETMLVDLKDLTHVPAPLAVQIFEAQENAKARVYEIDERLKVERQKWETLQGIANQFFGVINFKDIGKALALGGAPAAPVATVPASAASSQPPSPSSQPAAASGVIKLECGRCHQPTVFATREMIMNRNQAACSNPQCGAVWELEPAAPPPVPSPAVSNGAGGQDMNSAIAEILGRP